ncbi:hypothetical protein JWJ90_06360 [Desulfobulbus rhabdoformis]|uniref:hypothetical protein n=1 Tax=Desulfobulbus rhabdoformis TaxID=34032 RepID=UPI001964378E|nr:hypothetical protein [Desulfobulbus rhabdoformis]MBM9613911.1 hypothetical protein [Desulfobulbus rhabdoformis]
MRFLIILIVLFSFTGGGFAETKPIDTAKNKQVTLAEEHRKGSAKIAINPISTVDDQVVQELKTENAVEDIQPEATEPIQIESVLTKGDSQKSGQKADETLQMLSSLVELQKNLKMQIATINARIEKSSSVSEQETLKEELKNLDKQLNETGIDFERLATGVDSSAFSNKTEAKFSWKEEVATLLEPSIKELKALTAKARQKSDLKDTINTYQEQAKTAKAAIAHLSGLIEEAKTPEIKNYLSELLPAWENMDKRVNGKLDLAQKELNKLEANDVSFIQSSSDSVRNFFRERGLYLLLAFGAFIVIFIAFRLFARFILTVLPGARKEQRPVHVRFTELFLQAFSIIFAISGFILVLYMAEDWFLLSATIIFALGLIWAVRQTLPKMWQQVRLMLNMGSVREGERIIYQSVPWRVESINLFCKLSNPTLKVQLRLPIETLIGQISRPYEEHEPWFPCEEGDWVAIEGKNNAKVVSLTHEMVEVVELGGRKIVYSTAEFMGLSPANLSTNFFVRVVFGLSYDLQKEITSTVLEKLNAYMQQKFEEAGFAQNCLSLSVDFLQAGASSLDVVIFANMKGDQAPIIGRIERSISRWCVECSNQNNWEIPFPQLSVHLPENTDE